MNRLTRLVAASCVGLALALTASPALAAPTSGSRSNPAQVEHYEYNNPDGSSSEFRGVTRYTENEYYTTNARDQITNGGSSFDSKTHYMLNPKVTKLTSQNTFTEDGVTCRASSQSVSTNGETRTQKINSSC